MRIGAGWLSAGVAALLLTTGCKEGKPVVQQEGEQASAAQTVEQAQERSEQAFDQAKEAQDKASKEQEQVALEAGCDGLQGFLYAPALPREELDSFIEARLAHAMAA